MPLSFPQNPQTGSTYTSGGITWTWTGTVWQRNTNISGLDLTSVTTSAIPVTNNQVDLGTASNRWRDLYLADELVVGGATVTSSGSSLALPSGSTIGGVAIASGGSGGPKITSVVVTDSSWNTLDDTAVDVLGGYIKITGTSFSSGCLVYIGITPATSVSYISSTEVRCQLPAQAAGTQPLYLVNTDGGVAISVPGITFSASPSWQTASSLPEQYDATAISLALAATSATSYTITSGSLPPGLSLNTSTGLITGTVTGVTVDITYTFTVRATDSELQDSPRTFTVTITVSDPYFKLTTLLLSGDSANTVVRDSSTNNFNLTVFGDSRASNFTPYGTGWSAYFDGSGDYLSVASNAALAYGTGDFTVEFWINRTGTIISADCGVIDQRNGADGAYFMCGINTSQQFFVYLNSGYRVGPSAATTLALGAWYHIAYVRSGTTGTLYINGTSVGSWSDSLNYITNTISIARHSNLGTDFPGYLSNIRIIKGTALYTTNFTPATTNLTAVANTSLLTCQSNRFLDTSANNFTITRNGDTAIRSFNPFNLTNTGTNGSMYFDGSGDYLATPTNSALDFGTGDFTIEMWIYPEDLTWRVYLSAPNNTTTQIGYDPVNWSARNLYFYNGTQILSSSAGVISASQWNHIVVVRSGTTISMYANGNRTGTATHSTAVNFSPATIGEIHSTGNPTKGFMSELRLVKGTAVYNPTLTTLTVPPQPLTAVANTSLLTLQYRQPHNNNSFQDSSSNQFLITRSGNATQGTFSPFSSSGWSMFVGGAGYQRWDTNTNYSGTDLTIECWAYATATTTTYTSLISSNLGTGNYYPYFDLGIDGSNLLSCSFYGTSQVVRKNTVSFPLNTWVHCAVVLTSAGEISLYQAGQRVATGSSASIASISTGIQVGGLVQTSGGGYTAYFNGYISNARIVKSAVYSGATLTVPTTPLSVIANTNLLVCGENRAVDKANAYPIGVNTVSRTAVAFSPFAPTSVYSASVHGGSGYFDGSGDYLEMTYNPAFKFAASQDFCVEFWAYANASLTTNYILSQVSTNNWGFIFGAGAVTSGRMAVYYGNGASNSVQYLDDTAAFPLYQWIHVAWCRTSGTMSLFVDGTRRSTVSNTNAINLTSDRGIRIGAHQDGAASTFWPGYISSLRSIVGNSPYNATLTTLTIPTAPITTTANTSILLNFTDAAIQDATGRNVLETVADAKTSSVQVKYGSGSKYFDGTGDYLTIADNPGLELGTGDFTIEAWVYPTLLSGSNRSIFGHGTDSSNWWAFYLQPTGVLEFAAVSGGSTVVDRISSNSVSLNVWTHVAVTRNVSTFKIWINGSEPPSYTGSPSTTSSAMTDWSSAFWAGGPRWAGGSSEFVGYIDDLRVTRYARYTANFTPPQAAARLK